MKQSAALRVTGGICCYFAILSYFSMLAPLRLPMAFFTLAAFLASLLAVRLDAAPLRLLLALLPGACFLSAKPSLLLILPALAWLYLIIYLTAGRFNVAIYDYRSTYWRLLLVSGLCLLFSIINGLLFGGEILPLSGLLHLSAFFLLGVLALRQMQMGATMGLRWHAANTLTLLAVLLLTVGVSLGLYRLVLLLMPGFSFLFTQLVRFILWLYRLLVPEAELPEESTQTLPPPKTGIRTRLEGLFDEPEDYVYTEEEEEVPELLAKLSEHAIGIGAVLVLAAVVLLVLWVVIRHIRRGSLDMDEDTIYESTEASAPTRRRRRRKMKREPESDPAHRVRKVYREYLRYLEENGLHRTASNTSAEILSESGHVLAVSAPEEESLRRVYLKARYSAAAVTGEDVAAARRSLEAIRDRKQNAV